MSFEKPRDPVTDPERRAARWKKICSLNLDPLNPPSQKEMETCGCTACLRDLARLKYN